MSAQVEAELVALSEQKWQWMSQRQIEPLQDLFHEAAVFVHMGATMTKDQEIEVIRSGQIHYRDIEIKETSVRFIGDTAILLNRLQLTAVVGGNEVTNPFVVTEVYVDIDETWKLASLSFTRLVTH
jgi:translation elongation factor EF-4